MPRTSAMFRRFIEWYRHEAQAAAQAALRDKPQGLTTRELATVLDESPHGIDGLLAGCGEIQKVHDRDGHTRYILRTARTGTGGTVPSETKAS